MTDLRKEFQDMPSGDLIFEIASREPCSCYSSIVCDACERVIAAKEEADRRFCNCMWCRADRSRRKCGGGS